MKKLITCAILCLTLLTACTPQEISYAKMLPDPEKIFSNGKISIFDGDGGTAYSFNVKNYTEEEYENYVTGCKDKGFNNIVFQDDESFGAYTKNKKYWVEIHIDTEEKAVWILCQTSKSQ